MLDHASRRPARFLLAALLTIAASLGACDTVRVNPGLADRCWDFVRDAIPEGGVKLTAKTASGEMRTVVARVEAVRGKAPGGAHPIAAECRFEDYVLTDFRITQGP